MLAAGDARPHGADGRPAARASRLRPSLRVLLALAVVGVTSAVAALPFTDATVDGFTFLVAVLLLASRLGLLAGSVAAIAAAIAYAVLCLPPAFSLHLTSLDSWAALFSFLLSAAVAARLVFREQSAAAEAERRRRELEALYRLSVELFAAEETEGGVLPPLARALRFLRAKGGLLELSPGAASSMEAPGFGAFEGFQLRIAEPEPGGRADDAGSQGGLDPPAPHTGDPGVDVRAGGRRLGRLSVAGRAVQGDVLESVARLIGLAVERRGLLAERTRLEGLRQSETYRTALLRAVSHDLMTPMTALQVALENLSHHLPTPGRPAELASVRREAERLSRRLEGLLSFARVEKGVSGISPEPVPPADLFRTALDSLESVLEGRDVTVTVGDDCPDVRTDPPLASEILVNLLENAARLAPERTPLELRASRHGDVVALDVLDRGPGPSEVGPEGAGRVGLGLPICRALAEALSGSVTLEERAGGGARARLLLPAQNQEPSAAGRGPV